MKSRLVEVDIDTQTDAFMDRPASPLFIPMKTGVDVDTQIYDGELFDFDYEVEPILEVLVGKTLEQSMIEVMEEEELANMRSHQEQFIQMRAAEIAEAQRMEEAERRRFEEKERRAAQERQRLEREKKLNEKIAARSHARSYVSDVLSTTFSSLETEGFFYDPLLREINELFVPWLIGGMTNQLNQARVARQLVESVTTAVSSNQQSEMQKAVSARLKEETDVQAMIAQSLNDIKDKTEAQQKIDAEILAEKEKRRAEREAARLAAEEEAARLAAEQEAADAEGGGGD